MPKRSNDFQELVSLIQKALSPTDAVIRDSVLVDANGEAASREIDVLIETRVGEYCIKIAVEAKDEGRPMDSTKFEAIMGKYLVDGGIKVNKIVIVTHHGYFAPVIKRAEVLGVDLLTLKQSKEIDWAAFRPRECQEGDGATPPQSSNIRFSIPPHILQIEIIPPIDGQDSLLVCREGRVICECCGRDHGTVFEWARAKTLGNVDAQKMLEEGVRNAPNGHVNLRAMLPIERKIRIRFHGQSHLATHIAVHVHAANATSTLECTQFDLTLANGEVRRLSQMRATVGGKNLRFVMPDGLRSHRIVMRIDDDKKGKAASRKQAKDKVLRRKTRAKHDKKRQ